MPIGSSWSLLQSIFLWALYSHGGRRLCWEKWLFSLLVLWMCKKIYIFYIRILNQTILVCSFHETRYSWKTWNPWRFSQWLLVFLLLPVLCTRTNGCWNKEGHHWDGHALGALQWVELRMVTLLLARRNKMHEIKIHKNLKLLFLNKIIFCKINFIDWKIQDY